MRLYVGIDGGQSSTTALIGDEAGRVLGSGLAGPCNHAAASEGRRKFVTSMADSLSQAAESAGLTGPEVFEAACLGLSGGPDDKEALAKEMIRAERYLVTHDAHIALAGATGGEPGIIVIAGTGSIAFGRNAAGVTARAGGWGYVFGDEGGAFDLVRQALRAILRNEEGWGPRTALRDAMLEATGARDGNQLLHRFYTDEYPRDRVAGWANLIDEAARAGDTVAGDILGSAAQALATMTAAVRRQLFGSGEPVDVRYSGGVFGSDPLLARFRMLVELEEGTRVSAPQHNAAEGALLEAYRIGGARARLLNIS
ncbi:MAG: ATPase, BadF/BadG/BcrA/BcrD type [Bryobacterales bacterium]|nr:ATPase, BadF/BadG/BcrA/BcrD type [Bryobacterales bacterium]